MQDESRRPLVHELDVIASVHQSEPMYYIELPIL